MSADTIKRAMDCGRSGCGCSRPNKTHCPGPSHSNGDQNPSLGVTEKDGKVLVNCYGGCDQMAVIVALQDRDLWPRKEDRQAPSRSAPLQIVATYDYRDATGGLAFQVVRLEPKSFRQRTPNGRGGWDWKAGDRTLLYHLPELLAADPHEIVYACEGEKDVDRLISLGLTATTAAAGAGKWSDGNSRWLDGRRVVILPDNDEAGADDAAKKLASLQGVAAQVVILPLDGLPPKGDVSDWLNAGGAVSDLVQAAETALAAVQERTEAPVEIKRPAKLPLFPSHVLPPSMQALIESGAGSMLVPAEFIGLPMLVLAGAVIGNAWEIELKGGWREGPNLYAAIVGDPGAKKTPAMKLALRGVHLIQSNLAADFRAAKADFDEEYALWEKAPKKDRSAPPTAPKFQHLWTSDSTTEALAEMLSESKGLVLFRDELVGWVKSMDAYRSGGKGADRQHYLSMWSRSPIKIDRKSRPDPIIVDRPCLSVVGGIQPDVLPELVEHASRDDGFIDRLLFAYPDIGPDRWTEGGVDEGTQIAVERLFSGMYALKGADMPSGDVVPRVARFGGEARALWHEWYDENAAEHRDDNMASSLRGTWAKLPSQLARLTLILHIAWAVDAERDVSAIIPEATLAAAIVLVDYFKLHVRAVMGELRTPRTRLEERIVRGLVECGPSTTRTVQVKILNEAIKYDRVKSTLEAMLEEGTVLVSETPKGTRGRPGRLWTANESEASMHSALRQRSTPKHGTSYQERGA